MARWGAHGSVATLAWPKRERFPSSREPGARPTPAPDAAVALATHPVDGAEIE